MRLEVTRAVATDRTAESVALLADRLNDTNETVRSLARDTLTDFGRDAALTEVVRQDVIDVLAGDRWRGLEQAALIAGTLKIDRAAERLIALLSFDRAEVRLAAATALRQLAIPDTLPTLLKHTQALTDRVVLLKADLTEPQGDKVASIGNETTQLFMLFGEQNYKEAASLLRRYIPKHFADPSARGAAIYALGIFYENDLQPDLTAALGQRLSDVTPLDPEASIVRRFSAVALGRMKAESQLETLQHFYEQGARTADIQGACRWALMRITGEDLPPLAPITARQTGWFLEPIN